jgi:hypothetical protein
LTEDHTEPIEELKEKEEKRKIRVVEQMDNRLAMQGQAFMKGELKEALSLAYEIIELAKPEELMSFVKEQEEFINKIKKLLKEREEREKERIKLEQMKQKLERIKKLKTELKLLEGEINNVYSAGDFITTEELFKKAKDLLSQLDDKKIKRKWEDFEKSCLKEKKRQELIEIAEKLIEDSIELKEKFLFDELKLRLTSLIEQLRDNDLADYLKEIKEVESDIINIEKSYLKTTQKIEELVKEVKSNREEKKIKEAILNCEELIKLAESVKKSDISEEYSKILPILQKDLRFEELKAFVKVLNDEGLDLLKMGKIKPSLEKFNTIKDSIKQYLE